MLQSISWMLTQQLLLFPQDHIITSLAEVCQITGKDTEKVEPLSRFQKQASKIFLLLGSAAQKTRALAFCPIPTGNALSCILCFVPLEDRKLSDVTESTCSLESTLIPGNCLDTSLKLSWPDFSIPFFPGLSLTVSYLPFWNLSLFLDTVIGFGFSHNVL